MLSTDANGGRRPSQDAKEAAYQRRITELEAQVRWALFAGRGCCASSNPDYWMQPRVGQSRRAVAEDLAAPDDTLATMLQE